MDISKYTGNSKNNIINVFNILHTDSGYTLVHALGVGRTTKTN